mgnify:CR=1 FL=1
MDDEIQEIEVTEEDQKLEKRAKRGWIIFFCVLAALIVGCCIVIFALK